MPRMLFFIKNISIIFVQCVLLGAFLLFIHDKWQISRLKTSLDEDVSLPPETIQITEVTFPSEHPLTKIKKNKIFQKPHENLEWLKKHQGKSNKRFLHVPESHLRHVNLHGPGEMNKPVKIDKSKLSPSERSKYDLGWKRNAFNQYASDMISVRRSLPDLRYKECRSIEYPPNLPTVSVIIVFINEAWSALLRSVHSILDRSPKRLIKEIILVDDCSSFDHLGEPLEKYMKEHGQGKVKIIRAKHREGLIRTRMMGAAVARGEVLVFLDAHIETTQGWLEPLLHPIFKNWTTVVTPIIDPIHEDTLQINIVDKSNIQVGGFEWNLYFTWNLVSDEEARKDQTKIRPTKSPTMAGGLFAISKNFFFRLGQYDPGFDIWGGENLELSFKTWMCGGRLLTIPCSHVGHIFRKRSPYSWGNKRNVVQRNVARLAEVWLDEYKSYFYMTRNYKPIDFGDVSQRRDLRKRLKCQTFDWYLKNIYPQMYIPSDAVANGEVRSEAGKYCLDAGDKSQKSVQTISVYQCHGLGGNQMFVLNKMGEIRNNDLCMGVVTEGNEVETYSCQENDRSQVWYYEQNGVLRHKRTNKCLEVTKDFFQLKMDLCNGNQFQRWIWERGTPMEAYQSMLNNQTHL